MANTKDVLVEGVVPFDWMQKIDDDEMRTFGVWTMTPTTGLRIGYDNGPLRYDKNEYGGRTAMYRMGITGIEAINWVALTVMLKAWKRVGEVHRVLVADLDNGGAVVANWSAGRAWPW